LPDSVVIHSNFVSLPLTLPSFCSGDFDVTPTSYRHLLLESVRTGKPPVMIVPTLVHYKKSFQPTCFSHHHWLDLRKSWIISMPLELMVKKPRLMPSPMSFGLCCTLHQFIGKLHELCDEQEREVEQAILNHGKYRLRPQYHDLEVAERKWFAILHDQRVKHLKKVSAAPVSTKLATGEMPMGRGQKGGKAPARRKASLSIESRCEMTMPTLLFHQPVQFSIQ